MVMKSVIRTRPALLFGITLLLIAMTAVSTQAARQTELEVWDLPENLSQSGSATEPRIFVDASGGRHVMWLDALDGVIHSVTTEEGWSEPQQVEAPFSESMPDLFVDAEGNVHAFWQDEENVLFYSRLTNGDIEDNEAWTDPVQLAISVLSFDVVSGQDGRLHLTYIKNVSAEDDTVEEEEPVEEDPAGVYYRRSNDNGENWTEVIPVYTSLYYRLLEADEANVDLAASGSRIFIAWDDTPGERVVMVRSSDDGQTWGEIRYVDGREEFDELDATSPSWIDVAVKDDTVYLQWQAEHGGGTCTLYYQWSSNGGLTWQPRQRIFDEIQVCKEYNAIYFQDDLLVMLVSLADGPYYLLAWDSGQWSDPVEQLDLSDFLDPETFRPLALDCLHSILDGDRVHLVGCDELGDGDIWVTSRALIDASEFFPPPSIWGTPQLITSGDASIENAISVADADARIHVFWNQAVSDDGISAAVPESSIYYARWNARSWLGPYDIVSSPSGSAEKPAASLDSDGNLLLVWSGTAGDLYFSQAESSRAYAASAWADPIRLPVPRSAVGSSDVLVDRAGTIYVAYSIPLNEDRGIYITSSNDSGNTWSEPMAVFDGVAAQWDRVDTPHLAQTANGNLYLLWSKYPLPPLEDPLALYYSRFVNGSESWTDSELVTETTAVWADIRGVGDRVVHRVWQVLGNGSAGLWHEFSQDGGLTWSEPALIIPGFDEPLSHVSLTLDMFDRLHLLQMTGDAMEHWLWDGERWTTQEQYSANDQSLVSVQNLTSTGTSDLDLAVIYSALIPELDGELLQDTMFMLRRPLEAPEITPTPLPTLTPTPLPTSTATPVPGPSPSPTVVFSPQVSNEGGSLPSIVSREPLAFVIPAGLLGIVLILAGLRIRSTLGRRD